MALTFVLEFTSGSIIQENLVLPFIFMLFNILVSITPIVVAIYTIVMCSLHNDKFSYLPHKNPVSKNNF